jgi:hypothetical protein
MWYIRHEPMNTFLVVPTIRSLSFFSEWKNQFSQTNLIIVEDHPDAQIENPHTNFLKIFHYSWKDIKNDFGKDEWIFSRKNAGIRSYGFWKAYELGADVIITLDDDCFPVEDNFVQQHINNLSSKAPRDWFATFPHPDYMFTRGFPYSVRDAHKTVISHGLWSNKIDLDGVTEIKHPNINIAPYSTIREFIPKSMYFPMCSMNLAFSRAATPLMYFPLMGLDPSGKKWGYDRFDDIWAGIFAKKICDHLGLAVANGSPFVEHRRASSAKDNVSKERLGIKVNEYLWKAVDRMTLTRRTPASCYRELAEKIQFPRGIYFEKLRRAMIIWPSLF